MDEAERTPEQTQQEQLEQRQAVDRLKGRHFRQTHNGLSATQMEELIHLSGTDPVLRSMLLRGSPLTREHYIAHNWGPDLPEDQGAEFELQIPEPFRRKDLRSEPAKRYLSEAELVRSVMRDHPGLTEQEALRHLRDFGGH
jgi:hypothetical protein